MPSQQITGFPVFSLSAIQALLPHSLTDSAQTSILPWCPQACKTQDRARTWHESTLWWSWASTTIFPSAQFDNTHCGFFLEKVYWVKIYDDVWSCLIQMAEILHVYDYERARNRPPTVSSWWGWASVTSCWWGVHIAMFESFCIERKLHQNTTWKPSSWKWLSYLCSLLNFLGTRIEILYVSMSKCLDKKNGMSRHWFLSLSLYILKSYEIVIISWGINSIIIIRKHGTRLKSFNH